MEILNAVLARNGRFYARDVKVVLTHLTSKKLKPSGIKTGRKKVAFSGDGRINRFDQSTWVVCCGCGQETEGRNEMQMNKELRKAKCVPVRASRFYTRRI